MKRVLITGGAGFIAHHLIHNILKTTNWEIISLDRLDYSGNLNRLDNILSTLEGKDRARVKIVFHDLKSEINPWIRKEIGEVNIILHLAAGSHVDRSIEFPIEFVMDNVVATCNILNFSRKTLQTHEKVRKGFWPKLTGFLLQNKTVGIIGFGVMGKIRYLKKGKDVCLISYGPTVNIALGVAEKLQNKEKVSISIISCHTLKPLDIQGIAKALKTHKRIIVIEEMVENGGLAQNIKKIAWEIQAKCSIKSFSLQDRFIHFFGDHQQLLSEHGLDVDKIFRSCLK